MDIKEILRSFKVASNSKKNVLTLLRSAILIDSLDHKQKTENRRQILISFFCLLGQDIFEKFYELYKFLSIISQKVL